MGTQIMGMASAGVGATITRAGIIRIPEKRGVMFGGLKRRRNTAEICGRRRGIGDTHTSEWICKAIEPTTETPTTYQGFYGPWTIDPSDIREVVLYRTGLVAAAASFVVATSTAFLPDSFWLRDLLERNLDFLYLLGAAGLGLSLYLIHIYVTQIKRTLQALWLLGVFGSFTTYFALARPAGQGLVQFVVDNPTAIWFTGPIFASLTGLVIKEGLCYGKLEAAVLAFIIPTCLLGHLTGTMDNELKTFLLGVWVSFFAVFSGRKFTQPFKDDIGDKSVFMFNALPEEEKAVLEKSRKQKL
ncbi:uncharacterized protein LOC141644424 isoform X1 [Silene latifolia]|uniref:uncharacterized protein LOC141644424 isoform X1 n=1 Tax=Silene latifolia TaxID=37657 RepID=UPI003D777658